MNEIFVNLWNFSLSDDFFHPWDSMLSTEIFGFCDYGGVL